MNKHASNLLSATLTRSTLTTHAGTYIHDPRIDEKTHDLDGPFNYFLTPSDALGFTDTHEPVLHIASALAPLWLEPGKQVKVTNAPTDFGTISFTIDATEGGAKVSLDSKWRNAPKTMQFHIPWFADLKSASVDGKEVKAEGRFIELTSNARVLELKWTLTPKPELSYRKGVERYVDRYWEIQFGEEIPGFDSRWIFPEE